MIQLAFRFVRQSEEFCLSLPLTESKPGRIGTGSPIIGYSEPDERMYLLLQHEAPIRATNAPSRSFRLGKFSPITSTGKLGLPHLITAALVISGRAP